VPVETQESGTHTVVIGVYGNDGHVLAAGSAQVDVAGGRVLAMRTDRAAYVSEPIALLADMQGSGAGVFRLVLDGNLVSTTNLNLTGVQRLSLPLPSVSEGQHQLEGALTVNDLVSRASASFYKVKPPNQPPDCPNARAVPGSLWPANHKMKTISIAGVMDPDGDVVTIEITGVRQDEPVKGTGDGDTSPDATLKPLQVRAERAGSGNGRVYHVLFRATDGKGGVTNGEVTVCVPHDQGGGGCIDDGPRYDSTQP
jgi:hypothetical protein